MRFDAIVHAHSLRAGVRLNIAEADQIEGRLPERLVTGAKIWLRFGVCCPDLSRGIIIDHATSHERVVLAVGAEAWTLVKGKDGGVTEPGLISENWYVENRYVAGLD